MANDDKQADEGARDEQSGKAKSRGPLKLLIGVLLSIATGGALAVMAVPSKQKAYRFEGPYFAHLLDNVIVSTSDSNVTRYLKFKVDAEYVAYGEDYFASRSEDPFYLSYLKDRAQLIASSRKISESAIGTEREEFASALRIALDPVVFPVHIGATVNPLDGDEDSGLGPGISHNRTTFRGRFHEHILIVDAVVGVLQLDDGPEIIFRGDEDDLEVPAALGDSIFVDVTRIEPTFVGELKVGVHGKLRNIILEAIAQ